MALKPKNEQHRKQIHAGTVGRNKGHKFEKLVADEINKIDFKLFHKIQESNKPNIYKGNPAEALLSYISEDKKQQIKRVKAYWLGGRATANEGDMLLNEQGELIKGSKSDVLLEITYENDVNEKVGISVKACSNNAQLALTTASAFCTMLRENNIEVSEYAEIGLKMYCGDSGYRPADNYQPYDISNISQNRTARKERWYWEEIPSDAQKEWKNIFNRYQVKITTLLLQCARAYKSDPYKPTYILHECKPHEDILNCEVAIMSVEKFAEYSELFDKFGLKGKRISKGAYAGIDLEVHQYPHFGFIQFQPIGNKQNFSELQFNLKARYYNEFKKLLKDKK